MTAPHLCEIIAFPGPHRPRPTPALVADRPAAPYWPPAPRRPAPLWPRLLTLGLAAALTMVIASWTLQAVVAAASLATCDAACVTALIEGTAP